MRWGNKVEDKARIIQEFVPGKQITLAHLIANPQKDIFRKLGLSQEHQDAIGIVTITPSEGTIIAADVATKSATIDIGFIDRFSGTLVFTGDVGSVEAALKEILSMAENTLGFTITNITRS